MHGTGPRSRPPTPIVWPVSMTGSPGCASPIPRPSGTSPTSIARSLRRSTPLSCELAGLGAVVEPVDPGFDDPLEITTGLWFTGAWTLWNQLSPEQQDVTDPDFAAEARLGASLSNLDVQRLVLRRGELGSRMRQFMERYDLLVTPSVAVPAFEARPAGHTPLDPVVMLGWTPFSYPFNLTQQPACTIPCGRYERWSPDRDAACRPDVRRLPGAARRPRLRDGAPAGAAAIELTPLHQEPVRRRRGTAPTPDGDRGVRRPPGRCATARTVFASATNHGGGAFAPSCDATWCRCGPDTPQRR